MKILDFKSVSPLFEQERDGDKPFTIRKIHSKDKRFRALSQWRPDRNWAIRITNPSNGESFLRQLKEVSFLWYYRARHIWGLTPDYAWRSLILGERLD